MFPISPQTVMSAMCQPSLEPAVPLASVAPATCPSSQRDPGDASGTCMHTQTHTHQSYIMVEINDESLDCEMCIIKPCHACIGTPHDEEHQREQRDLRHGSR